MTLLFVRQLVSSLLPLGTRFIPRSVCVDFVVNQVAVVQIFNRVYWFCLSMSIAPVLNFHLFIYHPRYVNFVTDSVLQ
jgi:hypothetical protein